MNRITCLLLAAVLLSAAAVAQTPAADTSRTTTKPKATTPRAEEPMRSGDTLRTKSGLTVIILQKGEGKRAKLGQLAIAHYTGKLASGKIFDSSIGREPFAFRIGQKQVIRGWDEGFALLRVGDKARLIIPADLGYGSRGAGEVIPPNSELTFDVELLDLKTESVGDVLVSTINRKGVAQAEKVYERLKKSGFKNYYLGESELNRIGYEFLNKDSTAEAIAIFRFNADAFPSSSNVYDSLGEAYMKAGDKEKAIENYEKSLAIDPKNTNAVHMLKTLRGQ
jgi:FKBP-type peptidyl-prolyl cis-trans isomerase